MKKIILASLLLAACNAKQTPKYYLNIPDSVQGGDWLQMGRISNDTIYMNWHFREDMAMDYQIECTTDSMFIFDYGRQVGVLPYDSSKFAGIILQDNQ